MFKRSSTSDKWLQYIARLQNERNDLIDSKSIRQIKKILQFFFANSLHTMIKIGDIFLLGEYPFWKFYMSIQCKCMVLPHGHHLLQLRNIWIYYETIAPLHSTTYMYSGDHQIFEGVAIFHHIHLFIVSTLFILSFWYLYQTAMVIPIKANGLQCLIKTWTK